jgi:PhnB protein
MASNVKPIPDGYRTVTPYLTLNDAAAGLDWYKKALGAEEVVRMPGPGGKGVMHAEMRIGDSMVMLGDECPGADGKSPQSLGGTTMGIFLYVPDVDKAYDRAIKAGATKGMPPTNMFWGDRYCKFVDPFGHSWSMGTHIEDVPPGEMPERARKAMEQMGKPKG